MSIIYDALKKVEQAQKDSGSGIIKEEKRDLKPKVKLYLLYLLVVCFGIFIGNAFFGFLTHTDKSRPPAQVKPAPEASVKEQPQKEVSSNLPPPVIPRPLEIKKESKASLVLSGVFFSQEEGYALINNQIVKEGDSIGGAMVKRITLEEVELDKAGEIIRISAKPR